MARQRKWPDEVQTETRRAAQRNVRAQMQNTSKRKDRRHDDTHEVEKVSQASPAQPSQLSRPIQSNPQPAQSQWPACLSSCGIVPSNFKSSSQQVVVDLTQDGVSAPTVDSKSRTAEAWCDGRVVVYTDGASRNNQHAAIRRAGVGAFWANSTH